MKIEPFQTKSSDQISILNMEVFFVCIEMSFLRANINCMFHNEVLKSVLHLR